MHDRRDGDSPIRYACGHELAGPLAEATRGNEGRRQHLQRVVGGLYCPRCRDRNRPNQDWRLLLHAYFHAE